MSWLDYFSSRLTLWQQSNIQSTGTGDLQTLHSEPPESEKQEQQQQLHLPKEFPIAAKPAGTVREAQVTLHSCPLAVVKLS